MTQDGGHFPHAGPSALLFSNVASTSTRVNVTLRASLDGGASWPFSQLVSGPGGYSDVQLMPGASPEGSASPWTHRAAGGGDEAAVLYEKDSCEIELGIVSLAQLEDES